MTPGPWEVVREIDPHGDEKALPFVERIGPFHVEWHDDLNKSNHTRIEADISLVSAAPELLVALQAALPLMVLAHRNACTARDTEAIKHYGDTLDAMSAAIARATGEAK